MKRLNPKPLIFALSACGLLGFFCVAMVRLEAAARRTTAAARANAVSVDADNIGGAVASAKGPEAGVWVIAETADLGTKFRKIVVTNDKGQYLLPDLPKANYKVWVRGYGLVDSPPVNAAPGTSLDLKAVIAPTPQAAAQSYPANYWVSLLTIPRKSDFPMHVPLPPPIPGTRTGPAKGTHGNAPAPFVTVINMQAEWLFDLKGCWTCHQFGLKSTREIPASLGKFQTSAQAWERFMSSSQAGSSMVMEANRLGHDRAFAMYADWGDRIAKGEVPPAPPRPAGY